MEKAIAIIGTLDTKGDQIEYLKKLIEDQGYEPLIIDVGGAAVSTHHKS